MNQILLRYSRSKFCVIQVSVFFFILITGGLFGDERAKSEVLLSIPFEISPTGHQIVTLQYKGKPIRMILDTAAGANVFSKKSTKKLRLKVKKTEEKAAGLGTRGHAMTRVDSLEVSSGKQKLSLDNLVSLDLSHTEAAGGKKAADGLLGSPFFQTYNAQIDFATNQLILRVGELKVR